MMKQIKRYGMYLASLTVFRGIIITDTNELPNSISKKDYDTDAKRVHGSTAFQYETKKIEDAAKRAIYRTTSNLELIAYNRGILHAVETLRQRMEHPTRVVQKER